MESPMLKIGLVGVPGSGKTTLSRAIAVACRGIDKLNHVELVSEYARRYISKYGSVNSILEQYRILQKQLEWENSVCNEKLNIMITDSPVFLGFLYCIELPKTNIKEAMFFNDIFKEMVKLNYPTPRYDIIFHLNPILKPVDDGIRKIEQLDDSWREQSNILIKAVMTIFKPTQFLEINTPILEERVNFCLGTIQNHYKERSK